MTGETQNTGNGAANLPTYEQISTRAYQIYLERGRQNGHDTDDWLQAEYELLRLPVEKLAKMKPVTAVPPPTALPVRRSIVHVVRSALY